MHIQREIAEFISNRRLQSLPPDAPVSAAVEAMKAESSDCVLVCEDKRLLGIFTQRDFLCRVATVEGVGPDTPLRDVMTARPSSLRPGDSINYAINRMAQGGFRNVPIVDTGGNAIANLSVRDVMRHLRDIFAEIKNQQSDAGGDPWVDIGGG